MKSPFKINTESAAESEFSTTQKCLCDLKLLLFCQQIYVQTALHFVNVKH